MPAHPRKKRTPVSCEVCRERKIRCSRDGPPCQTCVRRRVPAGLCIYDTNIARPTVTTAQPPSSSLASRVELLENLLMEQRTPEAGLPRHRGSYLDSTPAATRFNQPSRPVPKGKLITSQSGHTRFLPAASSWNIIQEASPDVSNAERGNVVTDTPGAPYPFASGTSESLASITALLPPPAICDELVNIYFKAVGPIFPMIHAPTFKRQYREFIAEASSEAPAEWMALTFAVLGTAVLATDKDSTILRSLSRKATAFERITQLSQRYYSAAMACLEMDHYLWRHNLTTLQALLVLIYGIHHSRGQTWTLLGLTYHLALSIGCHVDPATFALDTVTVEERRRCWLGLIMLMCNQNMSMTGFDLQHMISSFSITLPRTYLDEELDAETYDMPTPEAYRLTPVAYFIRKYRLFQLSSSISNLALETQHSHPVAFQDLDRALRAEQEELSQTAPDGTETSTVFLNLLRSFSHHLMVLLHCKMLGKIADPAYPSWSKQCCWDSALQVLALHYEFTTSPTFIPYRWYIRGRGAFHALHSAVVLLLLLSADRHVSPPSQVMTALQNCLECLEAFKTQSQICDRAAGILDSLLKGFTASANRPTTTNNSRSNTRTTRTASQAVPMDPASSALADQTQFDGIGAWPINTDGSDLVNFFDNFDLEQWIDSGDINWQQLDMAFPFT